MSESSLGNIRASMESLNRMTVMESPAITASKRQVAAMTHLMSGDAMVIALKQAVDSLIKTAPADHDIIVHAFGIYVTQIQFMKPHTLLLRGTNQDGHPESVVAHYSQMIAHVIYRPKAGPERVITGFSTQGQ